MKTLALLISLATMSAVAAETTPVTPTKRITLNATQRWQRDLLRDGRTLRLDSGLSGGLDIMPSHDSFNSFAIQSAGNVSVRNNVRFATPGSQDLMERIEELDAQVHEDKNINRPTLF